MVRSDWFAYGVALAAPFVVLWLYLFLGFTTVLYIQILRMHGQQNLQCFLLFLVAVVLSAYLGGAGPGLVSTLVAAGLIGSILPPHLRGYDLWRLAPTLVAGALVSLLVEHWHRKEGRRKADRRLAEVTLASIGEAVITTDANGKVSFMNGEAERLTGWESPQAVGRPLAKVFVILEEETRRPCEEPLKKVVRLGAATKLTNHTLLLGKVGQEISIAERAAPIRHPDGTLEGIVIVFHDATESRMAETELRKRLELQDRISHIINSAPAGVYSFCVRPDGTTSFPFASPAIEEVFGTSSAELARDGSPAFSKIHPDDLARVSASMAVSAQTMSVWQCEFRVATRNGLETWLEGRAVPERDADGGTLWYGFLSDIAARKRADETLRQSEHKFRSYVENAPVAVFVADREGRLLEFNAAAIELFGYEQPVFETLSVWDLHPHEERERVLSDMTALRSGGRVDGEYQCIRQDGRVIWILLRALMLDADHFLGFLQDITERRRAEQELRESRQRLQFAMDAGQLGVWSHDLRTDEVSWDDRCREMLGLSPDETASLQHLLSRIDPESGADFIQFLSGQEQETERDLATEYRIKLSDGSERWVLMRGSVTRDSSGEPLRVDGLLMDITEQRKAEAKVQQLQEQYRHSQKMEAVGRLAGGVAHDFNNLLMVIQGYTEILQDEMEDVSPGKKYADQILMASSRAAGLTRQLLAFSRKQILCPVVLNMNQIVEETSKMMARLMGEDISLKQDLAPSLWTIKADPDQIGQVLMNLAVNSRDAMPQGGVLSIATRNVSVKYDGSEDHAWVGAGDYVALTVTDTGTGMPKEVKDHLFEPFFTTKEEGKGTGLGLATVYGIVQQSDGYVWADSEEGHGACFTIYLPAAKTAASKPLPVREEQSPLGAGTLLVVEDEISTNRTLVEFLRGRGYTVLTANSPAEALVISGGCSTSIDLLLADIVMPGMRGTELAWELGKLRPGIKTIFMSGYIDDDVVRRGIAQSNATFLQKPFSLHLLAQKVKEVIASPHSGRASGCPDTVVPPAA